MVPHIMKTSVEIADDLIARVAGSNNDYNVPAHPTIPPSTGITTPVT